jgi:hypothetical protein
MSMAARGRGTGAGAKQITWIICLVLYLVALAAHFRIIHISGEAEAWSWILGFGVLLLADKVRGL